MSTELPVHTDVIGGVVCPETHLLREEIEYKRGCEIDGVVNQLLKVRMYNPLRNSQRSEWEEVTRVLDSLNVHGLDLDKLSGLVGPEIYENNRFSAWLVSKTLEALGSRKDIKYPTSEFDLELIRYLSENRQALGRVIVRWEENKEHDGVVTAPPFYSHQGDLEGQVERYVEGRNEKPVDVFSSPGRYPSFCEGLREVVAPRGTVIEFGCAAGDLLLDLEDHFSRVIGVDSLNMQDILYHAMMIQYRWQDKDEIGKHMERIKNFTIFKEDLFESELYHYLSLMDIPRPLVLVYLNSLFPHYDAQRIEAGLSLGLELDPDYIAIGGSVPELEQQIPSGADSGTIWRKAALTRVFDLRENNGQNGKPILVKTAVS